MIQRIQSVYLAISAVLLGLTTFMKIVEFSVEQIFVMTGYRTVELSDPSNVILNNMGIGILGGVGALFLVFTILQFKKRPLQAKLAKGGLLLSAIQLAAMFLYSESASKILGEQVVVNYKPAIVFPIISMVLCFLAAKAIKKDEDLVRSVDRLR